MRYKLTVVEQLDRAIRELRIDHPINNRLALILVDNATELILHRRCRYHADLDRVLQKLSPRQRMKARGVFLDGKLKVLEAMGDISGNERAFIAIAHHYRNELYHVGLKHDGIIRSMTGCYFELCCDLFERLKPGWSSVSSTDSFSEILDRYLPEESAHGAFSIVESEVFTKKLREQFPTAVDSLQETLAENARQTVEKLKGSLDFVVHENPGSQDFGTVLRNIQWHFDFTRALEREGVEGTWMVPGYLEGVERVRSSIEPSWRQRYKTVPAANWLKRADAIECESDELKAMARFQALRNDMQYLEEAISMAAIELDTWIQSEIDRARGK